MFPVRILIHNRIFSYPNLSHTIKCTLYFLKADESYCYYHFAYNDSTYEITLVLYVTLTPDFTSFNYKLYRKLTKNEQKHVGTIAPSSTWHLLTYNYTNVIYV